MDETERLKQWLRDHGPAVQGYLLGLQLQPTDVEDVLQETFFRAWQDRHRYRDTGSARGYLLRIADRLARDVRRRQERRRRRELNWQSQATAALPRAATPGDRIEQTEVQAQLANALQSLTEPQRRTLLLHYFGGLEFRDIAQQLACPVNTVLSHARRGLQALRKLLPADVLTMTAE